MGRRKKVEDKKVGTRRALIYKEKYFYYTDNEEKKLAAKKVEAYKVLLGDK